LFRQLDTDFDTKERIRLRAYEIYEQRGKTEGHALDDWLRAEAELTVALLGDTASAAQPVQFHPPPVAPNAFAKRNCRSRALFFS
jgi:hypothetical protein